MRCYQGVALAGIPRNIHTLMEKPTGSFPDLFDNEYDALKQYCIGKLHEILDEINQTKKEVESVCEKMEQMFRLT